MTKIFTTLATLLLAGAASAALAVTPAEQKAHESAFDASVSAADQLGWLKTMSSAPNHVGSPHDRANAEFLLGQYKSFGWDAHIETFQVLYPTPISTTVEMVAPDHIVLGGQEPAVPGDATSSNTAGALPPYVAYQGDGDVTASLVYVNFGMPDDYDALARMGVDVKGKIVIVRYGVGWRGLKPKLAQEHGAIGCIIYSDPDQDGYHAEDDVYPKGGTRPAYGVQRGSVVDMPIVPGDPLTPGIGATGNAKRLTRATAPTILKIPALPMSYGDAQKLLAGLDGPVAPHGWQGGLPLTYHLGGGGAVKVHLAVRSDWSLEPIHDVIAMLPGSRYPDQWVIRGNHHDGWVFGANDPLAGNVAMLSEAKALGALWKSGWRPQRTIVYASWDGEEPGLLGSTEWAEQHGDELRRKGVIYINSDTNGRGSFAPGWHDWQHLVNAVAADVVDPETGASAAARSRAKLMEQAYEGRLTRDDPALQAAIAGADLPLGALGSGSDYTAFLQHLGLPALNIGYGGEDESGGVYHSVYDSFDHMTRFDDPGLRYGEALSKTAGRLVLRIADSDTPPQRFGDFAAAVDHYLGEIQRLGDARRAGDRLRDRMAREDAFRIASDPARPLAAPASVAPTPHVELAVLEDSVDRLKASAAAYDAAYAEHASALPPARRERLNLMLRDIDQLLLSDKGLPFRPWFRNLVYAPGRFTGYGAKTLPGVREAIEERRFDDAMAYAKLTAAALNAYSDRLDQAKALVEGK